MIRLLLAASLTWSPAATTVSSPSPGPNLERFAVEDKAIRALNAWLKHYRSGKIHFLSKDNIAKDSIAAKFGLPPATVLGTPTWASDLETILEAVAKLDDAEAAEALLEVAATGIDAGKYTLEMAPYEVREAGERWVVRLASAPAKEALARAARGESKTDKGKAVAVQAAAVRCLGLMGDTGVRPTIEPLLADSDEIVRINAAEALGNLGDEAGAPALIGALERESADSVLRTVAQALRTLYARHLPQPGAGVPSGKKEQANGSDKQGAPVPEEAVPASARLAVQAAIKALGRATWRADMALVRLLDDFRSLETVPALISVLERFRDHPDDVKSGRLSGLLLYQAHELLVGMTGAVFPADQPEKWRELWERERGTLQVAKKHEPKGPPTTVSSGFCGIPVQGTRVVFVLDLSGSMNWPMGNTTSAGGKSGPTRLDYAKQELHRAMTAISPNAQFTLVAFNGEERAAVWSKNLVPATDKNRERFLRFVDQLVAEGGTNLWAGLEEALKIKSLVYGSRYESNVDEVFILSDGAPSVGQVIDPIEILRLVCEGNRFASMRLNTVFISSPPPAGTPQPPMPHMTITAEELMKRMAEQNGGRFKNL